MTNREDAKFIFVSIIAEDCVYISDEALEDGQDEVKKSPSFSWFPTEDERKQHLNHISLYHRNIHELPILDRFGKTLDFKTVGEYLA